MEKSYKVVLLGDGYVGKTRYINRHIPGHLGEKFIHQFAVCIHPIGFQVSFDKDSKKEKIFFKIWDSCGQEKISRDSISSSFLHDSIGFFLFFDLTQPKTLDSLDYWILHIRKHLPDSFIFLLGTKYDIVEKSMKEYNSIKSQITNFLQKNKIPSFCYCNISSVSNYQWSLPFQYLICHILKTKNCVIDQVIPLVDPVKEREEEENQKKEALQKEEAKKKENEKKDAAPPILQLPAGEDDYYDDDEEDEDLDDEM